MCAVIMLGSIKNCVILIVFVSHLSCCCDVTSSLRVVGALQRHFYTKCVFLLHTETHGKYSQQNNVSIQKLESFHELEYLKLFLRCIATNHILFASTLRVIFSRTWSECIWWCRACSSACVFTNNFFDLH